MQKVLEALSLTPTDALMIPVGTVLFFILWRLLDRNLFTPYLALVEERERATTGAVFSADEKLEEARAIRMKVEERLTSVRIDAMKKKLDVIAQARVQAQKIIDTAQAEADAFVKEKRRLLNEESDKLRSGAFSNADSLAGNIAERVLTQTSERA